MRFGGLEILIIFAIVLLFFGPKQIPKLTATIKESIANFKGNKDEAAETSGPDKREEVNNSVVKN